MAGFQHAMAWFSDAFSASSDGVDGEFVEDTKHAGSDAASYSCEVTQALGRQGGRPFERQTTQDSRNEFLKLLICFPAWQHELIEAAGQLDIAGDRITCFCNAEANQRCLELVAQIAE